MLVGSAAFLQLLPLLQELSKVFLQLLLLLLELINLLSTMSLFYMYIRYIYIIFYSFCCEASPASGGPAVHAGISVTPPASWWHSSASALPAPVQNVSVSPRRPGSVRQIDKEMENVR